MAGRFKALLNHSHRLISDDFSEIMWKSGYADFDSHAAEVTNIARFSNETLSILRPLLEEDNLLQVVVEGIEEIRSHSVSSVRKLLCLLAACMKMPAKPNKHTYLTMLHADGVYLRLAPLSKHLGVGFFLFQKHIYLSLTENMRLINGNPSEANPKLLLSILRHFPNFISEVGMEDHECLEATAELFARLAYSDVSELPHFSSSRSLGILTLKETDISSLGIGCVAFYCLGEMTRRYTSNVEAIGSIYVAFFPLLLCVDSDACKKATALPAINAQTARQSDLLADFLGHLTSDLHVHAKISPFIQQLIDRTPEKADYRDRSVKVTVRLAKCLTSSPDGFDNLIKWAIHYGRTSRAGSRVIAIELLHGLRNVCSNEVLNMIIRHFLSRANDVSSSVRIRALALLSDCLTSLHLSKSVNAISNVSSEAMMTGSDTDSRSSTEVTVIPKLELEIAVLTVAVRLANDSRVHVRRTALSLLETCLPMIVPACNFTAEAGPGYDTAVIFRRGFETCAQRCVDCSVLVRNQASKTTTEVLVKTLGLVSSHVVASEHLSWLGRIWLSSVLPLVGDQEQRIQEKTIDLISGIIIPSVLASDTMPQKEALAWSLLNLLALKARSLSGHFRSGLTSFLKAKQPGTFPKINHALKAAADTIEANDERFKAAAWFLVAEITAALGTVSESKRAVQVLERLSPGNVWLRVIKRQGDDSAHLALTTCECILGVLAAQVSYAAGTLSGVRESLTSDLSSRLSKCTIPMTLIRASATVLFLLSAKEAQKVLSPLVDIVMSSEATKVPTDKMRRCLSALGTVGELCVGTSSSMARMGRLSQITDVAFARLTTLAQNAEEAPLVKAQCLFTIGQLCIADQTTALRMASFVSGFLSNANTPVIVKMAALSVLTDWCIWHTGVVAKEYIDQIASCLHDEQPLLRRHTLGAISRLLDGSYILWTDALFFRFVATVIDDDVAIQSAAKRYLEMIVLPRNERFFLYKFIDTMLRFNGYVGTAKIGMALSQSQPTQSQSNSQIRKEKHLATMCVLLGLSGNANRKRRFGIYRYMIDSMGSAEERLGLMRRLIDNVLLATVREEIDVANQPAGEAVIRDACLILSDDRMKFSKCLSTSGGLPEDEDDVAVDDENIARRVEAKRVMFAQAVRVIIVKEFFPAIVALRAFMERVKPTMLSCVCDLLVASYGEYKSELSEALADDPELHRELEFHMRQALQRQREEAALRTLVNQPEDETSEPDLAIAPEPSEAGVDEQQAGAVTESKSQSASSENSAPIRRSSRSKPHTIVEEEEEPEVKEEPVDEPQPKLRRRSKTSAKKTSRRSR